MISNSLLMFLYEKQNKRIGFGFTSTILFYLHCFLTNRIIYITYICLLKLKKFIWKLFMKRYLFPSNIRL